MVIISGVPIFRIFTVSFYYHNSINNDCLLNSFDCPLNSFKYQRQKIAELANSVDLDEVAHNEPPHLDIHCLLPSL